ncbi:Bug family tripartite tricarboxylate transporter substrate binding protein [Bordetella petrii]|uniref:Bug family tripartite tricarboxylate transporter substrate binding protein n=1 Tax=Bordetella petrii TaxID=94624 RepID=UPI001A97613B|nr:tripartite tricarboxylate transporter substrate binding protein [Bordetella petrii]MBO1113652.1 tripartite tricarboxylate transporter substrate binding protein [Bordetella petrii]
MAIRATLWRLLAAAAWLAGSMMLAGSGMAQPYPQRAVTLVTPFSVGGDADLAARNLAAATQRYLGQPLVVLNRAGANGAIGSQYVKEADPDGYTLLMARVGSQAILPALQQSLSYRWDDFTFLGLLELNPYVCAVPAKSPHHSLADLVAAIKARPGVLNYANSGPATVLNLGPQLLFSVLGLPPTAAMPITYKGSGDAVVAALSGQVDFVCTNYAPISGPLHDGRLRALVTTTPARLPTLPDVPTAREAGFPQLEVITGWSALYGPPGMDKAAVRKWAEVLRGVSSDRGWNEGTRKLGSVPDVRAAAATREFVQAQVQAYQKLGRATGISLK